MTEIRSSGSAIRLGLAGALACLALASGPYLVGFAAAPEGRVYTGLMFDVPDHAQYWSWVTSSRRGLFIPNTMTPEPNAATFLNPAMWLLAQVQALFGLSFAALFQWWRVAAAVVVGPALAVTMLRLARSGDQARVAFWLALAGGGFGWIFVVAKYALGLADAPFPEAIYFAEPNTWFGLFAYPYLPLAQGFILIALVGAFRVHTAPGPGAWAALRRRRARCRPAARLRPGGRLRGRRRVLDRGAGTGPGDPVAAVVGTVVVGPGLLGAVGRLLPGPDLVGCTLAVGARALR